MSGANQDAGELWSRMLAGIAATVSPGCFDTWFRSLRVLRLDGSVLEVTAPTETFRALFPENYLALLHQLATEVAGSGIEFRFSTREPENSHDEGCAHDTRAQPLVHPNNSIRAGFGTGRRVAGGNWIPGASAIDCWWFNCNS